MYKIVLVVLAASLVGLIIISIGIGIYQTNKVQHDSNQKLFTHGSIPDPLPDGFYHGNAFIGFGKNWQGKVFDQANHIGINQFADGKRYSFKTYQAKGLRDSSLQVLRIDYNQSGNPWWLHFITDEIVQTSPNHYLGKVHLRVIPGITFTLTYFELSK